MYILRSHPENIILLDTMGDMHHYYFLLVLEVSVFHINNLEIVCNTSYVLYSPNILGILVRGFILGFTKKEAYWGF